MSLSTFLNGRDPVCLRGLLWLALSDAGQRGTATHLSDSGGGVTSTWAWGGTVACRLDPMGDPSGAALIGARIDERSTYLVTVAPGVDVASSDRWRITGRGTFEVTAVREQTAEMARTFEVLQIT